MFVADLERTQKNARNSASWDRQVGLEPMGTTCPPVFPPARHFVVATGNRMASASFYLPGAYR